MSIWLKLLKLLTKLPNQLPPPPLLLLLLNNLLPSHPQLYKKWVSQLRLTWVTLLLLIARLLRLLELNILSSKMHLLFKWLLLKYLRMCKRKLSTSILPTLKPMTMLCIKLKLKLMFLSLSLLSHLSVSLKLSTVESLPRLFLRSMTQLKSPLPMLPMATLRLVLLMLPMTKMYKPSKLKFKVPMLTMWKEILLLAYKYWNSRMAKLTISSDTEMCTSLSIGIPYWRRFFSWMKSIN